MVVTWLIVKMNKRKIVNLYLKDDKKNMTEMGYEK